MIVNDELKGIWKVDRDTLLYKHSYKSTEEKYENFKSAFSLWAEIWTLDLPNT
jgi:hypothetical protein